MFHKSESRLDFTTALDVVMMGTYGSLGWIKRPGAKRKRILEAQKKWECLLLKKKPPNKPLGRSTTAYFFPQVLVCNGPFILWTSSRVFATTEIAIINISASCAKRSSLFNDLQTVPEYSDWVTFLNTHCDRACKRYFQ
jgi:manganese/zinc/iron transport system ATP- binding protein